MHVIKPSICSAMPDVGCYHIYISHAWRYGEAYERLVERLSEAPHFQFLNWSASGDKPVIPPGMTVPDRSVRGAIRAAMAMADCVVVLGGLYAAHRAWMQAEIDIARALPRPLIALRPWGEARQAATVLAEATVEVVWEASVIVQAIRENARPR